MTIVQRARARVSIWTGDRDSRIDVDEDVIAFNYSKTIDAPSGQFSVTLLPRTGDALDSAVNLRQVAHYYRTVRPNHMVSLGVDEDGGIMLGLVDRVARTHNHAGPSVSMAVTISGRCCGKVLEVDHVIRASLAVGEYPKFRRDIEAAIGDDTPLLDVLLGLWAPVDGSDDGVPTFIGKSLDEVIEFILSQSTSMRLPLMADATGGTGKASDYISVARSVTTWNADRIYSDSPSEYEGTVWSFVWGVIDPDFYELRLDYQPNESRLPELELIVRPKPFDEQALQWAPTYEETGLTWEKLTTQVHGRENHEIPFTDLVSANLGFGDGDALSYYLVTSQHDLIGNANAQAEGLYYPLVDLYVARRFGLKAYQAQLSLVSADLQLKINQDDNYVSAVSTEVHEFRNRLFNWYRMNPWFESGSITVPGRDEYRCGDPVFLPWAIPAIGDEPGLRYYCIGVSQSWQLGPAGRVGQYLSTLSLTRGHNAGMIKAFNVAVSEAAQKFNTSTSKLYTAT